MSSLAVPSGPHALARAVAVRASLAGRAGAHVRARDSRLAGADLVAPSTAGDLRLRRSLRQTSGHPMSGHALATLVATSESSDASISSAEPDDPDGLVRDA